MFYYGLLGSLISCGHGFNHTYPVTARLYQSTIILSEPVKSGILQGSTLGPLLFVIYLDDISSSIMYSNLLSLLHDDVKCYKAIHNPQDSVSTV